MKKATVISGWVKHTDGITYPELVLDYPPNAGEMVSDVTNQPWQNIPTNPNITVMECVYADTTMTAIEADSKYIILSMEEIVDAAN